MVAYLNFHTGAAFCNALVLGALAFFGVVVFARCRHVLQPEASQVLLVDLMSALQRSTALLSGVAAMLIFYRYESILLAVNAGLGLFAWLVLLPAYAQRKDASALQRAGLAALHIIQAGLAGFVFFRLAA